MNQTRQSITLSKGSRSCARFFLIIKIAANDFGLRPAVMITCDPGRLKLGYSAETFCFLSAIVALGCRSNYAKGSFILSLLGHDHSFPRRLEPDGRLRIGSWELGYVGWVHRFFIVLGCLANTRDFVPGRLVNIGSNPVKHQSGRVLLGRDTCFATLGKPAIGDWMGTIQRASDTEGGAVVIRGNTGSGRAAYLTAPRLFGG